MTPVVALVLMSALLHAGWNLCIKRHPDPVAATTAIIYLTGLCALVGWASVALLSPAPAFASVLALLLALACGLSESATFACLGRALRDGTLGMAYTVSRGGSILIVWPIAYLVQGERATPLQLAGIVAMVAGLRLLYPRDERPSARAGYAWAISTALAIAVNHVLYKAALTEGCSPWPLFTVAMLVAGSGNLLLMRPGTPARRVVAAIAAQPVSLVAAALQASVGFGLALYALQMAGAAWVSTLRNTSVAVAPVLGWLFLGEKTQPETVRGFLLVVAATLMLSL